MLLWKTISKTGCVRKKYVLEQPLWEGGRHRQVFRPVVPSRLNIWLCLNAHLFCPPVLQDCVTWKMLTITLISVFSLAMTSCLMLNICSPSWGSTLLWLYTLSKKIKKLACNQNFFFALLSQFVSSVHRKFVLRTGAYSHTPSLWWCCALPLTQRAAVETVVKYLHYLWCTLFRLFLKCTCYCA